MSGVRSEFHAVVHVSDASKLGGRRAHAKHILCVAMPVETFPVEFLWVSQLHALQRSTMNGNHEH